MGIWKASKAKRVLKALLNIGWQIERQKGSHRFLVRPGWSPYPFAYHDNVEIGPAMLADMSKRTGLKPEDL